MTIWSFKAFSWAWPNRNVSQIVFPWVDSESSCNVTSTSSLIYSFWAQKYHVSFKSPFLWRFIHWSWTWREVEREQQSMNKLNLIAVLIKFNPTKYDRVLKILHFFDNYFLTFLGGFIIIIHIQVHGLLTVYSRSTHV